MGTTIREQIERVGKATDPNDLWPIARDFFFSRGATMIGYRHFVGRPDRESSKTEFLVSEGFPESFLEHLFEQRLALVNPVPELASRSTDPFIWSEISKLVDLAEDEETFVYDYALPKLGDGLAIPVFGPQGRNGLFNVGFGRSRPAFEYRELKEMQLAAEVSHLAFVKLTPDFLGEEASMTAREREVLKWIAKGKSNSVIAEILGISTHTVDTHVRRIFRKLGVNDRTTAAVKGLGAGLVQTSAPPESVRVT